MSALSRPQAPPLEKLSVVIPFFNEADCARDVLEEAVRALPGAEIIAVDDGSRDGTWEIVQQVEGVRALRLGRNSGQSAAIYAGLRAATRPYRALLDGDGQNDPADLPRMLDKLLADEAADVICGYRAKRKDTWSRRAASRFANGVRRMFIRDGVRDTGCSVKVFPAAAVELLVPFNGLHRFLPAIFRHAGLRLIEEPVNHRPRLRGTSKYTNWERALRGLHDLIGVSWLLKRKVVLPPVEEGPS